MEKVGETVADVVGLNDSKFQYVIDSMTEEEWENAQKVNQEREEQNIQYESAMEASKLESGEALNENNLTGLNEIDMKENEIENEIENNDKEILIIKKQENIQSNEI